MGGENGMGAWGTGNLDNDRVRDWLADLEAPEGVERALHAVVGAAEEAYLDADACCAALGAAEIVAACGGQPVGALPEKVSAWVAANRGAVGGRVRDLAVAAVQRVEASSELRDLFDEEGPNQAWHGVLEYVLGRLSVARFT